MKTPLFIAKRYILARKSHNVINIISGISVCGVALASFALIGTLSVFNGFNDLVKTLFTNFDPQLKIVSHRGNAFSSDIPELREVKALSFVDVFSMTIEEQALIEYKNTQEIVTLKGVDDEFYYLSGIENILIGQGIYMLADDVADYGILGLQLARKLNSGIEPVSPFNVYAPLRGVTVNMANPAASFNSKEFFSPGVVFQVNQPPYDESYVLVSINLNRRLFGYESEITAVELRLIEGVNLKKAKSEISKIMGPNFRILDRYEQHADVFKVFKLEKFISFIFLTLILLIASFNIIGSLIMLMVEKRKDVNILNGIGASKELVSNIFIYQGLLISLLGALSGVVMGVIVVLLQQKFGFIPLGSSGGFVVDSYPVSLRFFDVLAVLGTVMVMSLITIWPIRSMAGRFFRIAEKNEN